MLLKKSLLFFICILLGEYIYSQNYVDSLLSDFEFNVIKIEYKGKTKCYLFGTEYNAHKFILKDTVTRQTASEPYKGKLIFKLFREKWAIYVVDDTEGIIKDTLIQTIKADLERRFELLKQYGTQHLAIINDIYFDDLGNYFIEYYRNRYFVPYKSFKFNQCQYLIWKDNKVFGLEFVSSDGAGGGHRGLGTGSCTINSFGKLKFDNFKEKRLTFEEFFELYESGVFD